MAIELERGPMLEGCGAFDRFGATIDGLIDHVISTIILAIKTVINANGENKQQKIMIFLRSHGWLGQLRICRAN